MSRKLNDMTQSDQWPPSGAWTVCECLAADYKTVQQGNNYVELCWTWDGGDFRERLYVTDRTVKKLAVFVARLLPDAADKEWPDDDGEASEVLARYIADHAHGIVAELQIADRVDAKGKTRQQVTFAGYRLPTGAATSEPPVTDPPEPTRGDEPEPEHAETAVDSEPLPF